MNAVTRHFHTPREQVLDRVNHDEAVAELVPWEVLYRGLDVEADALRDCWNTRANRYAAALSSASQNKPTSLSCPSGHQSHFAGDIA